MLEKKYKAEFSELEIQKYWKDNNIFDFMEDNREVFSIDNPPPTVSGNLHIGHIFSYTQTEMIARYKRMCGYNVFYPFGFDDNGLPSERLVEKDEKIFARDLPKSDFTYKCKSTVEKYENEFKSMWKSLGFSVDWRLQYETINDLSQKISQKSFIELVKMKKAYQKEMPVLWCVNCRTSIAQAELESKSYDTTFNTLKFKVNGKDLLIATTRPELLPACVAIFVHPEDKKYAEFIGKKARVPIFNFEVEIMSDDKVDMEKGTGIVMCCTFGDSTDLEWYEKYNLPYKKAIEKDGCLTKEIDYIGGMYVKKARKEIIKILKEKNLLVESNTIDHTVNIHERCGTDVEIIPSKQWYIDILSEKDTFLKMADKINWYPSFMKSRYINWVQNLKWDWCISRQRYFGVSLPVWYCKDCENVILPEMDELPVNPLEDNIDRVCECGCDELIPEKAVMDTWATSSMTPFINSKWKEKDTLKKQLNPMSLRTQSHEIIRTWTFYTIVKSFYHTNDIPWKDIMLSGFVLAKKGEKISKSKGNSKIEPKKLIKQYSADAVRYWAANNKLGTDTWFSEIDIKKSHRLLTKLWNVAKFSLMHLEDFEENIKCLIKDDDYDFMPSDRWIINKFNDMQNKFINYMKKYEIGLARQVLDSFFWQDYCDDYIELVKDRLYKPLIHGKENRIKAQRATAIVSLNILKLYSIFIPHITEYIYLKGFRRILPGESICKKKIKITKTNAFLLEFGDIIKLVLSDVRKYKSDKNLSMKTEIDKLIIHCDENLIALLKESKKDIKACTSAKEIEFEAESEMKIKIIKTI